MALTIHHLQTSQSERIIWFCEELGVPYELKLHQRNPLLAPPEFAELHRMKAAPVVVDGTVSPPITLAESPAILEYISHIHAHSRLILPPSHPDYASYLYWFHFTPGTLQPVLGRYMLLTSLSVPAEDPRRMFVERKFRDALTYLDERVDWTEGNTDAGTDVQGRGCKWLAGEEFSAADVLLTFSLTTMRRFINYDLSQYKGILGYLGRIGEREAYVRAMGRGDPDMDWKSAMTGEGPEGFAALGGGVDAYRKK